MYSAVLIFGKAIMLNEETIKEFGITNVLKVGTSEELVLFCNHYNACKEANIPFQF